MMKNLKGEACFRLGTFGILVNSDDIKGLTGFPEPAFVPAFISTPTLQPFDVLWAKGYPRTPGPIFGK